MTERRRVGRSRRPEAKPGEVVDLASSLRDTLDERVKVREMVRLLAVELTAHMKQPVEEIWLVSMGEIVKLNLLTGAIERQGR